MGGVDGDDDWTDEEKLLLLEGIEMYDDDWFAVSEHVRTRSKEQCVAQFLQMPIEDAYINPPREGDLGALAYGRIPFDQTDNPVMSVVAFLAGAVGPGVAAAAAQSAIGELTDGLRRKVKKREAEQQGNEKHGQNGVAGAGEGEEQSPSANPKEESTVDEDASAKGMDVDGPTQPADLTSRSKPNSSDTPIPRNALERAAATALAAAAARATLLANHETEQIRSLTNQIVKASLKKIELKLTHFEALEELMESERKNLEASRQTLLRERAVVKKSLDEAWALATRLQEDQNALNGMGGLSGVQNASSMIMQNAGIIGPGPMDVDMTNPFADGQGAFLPSDGALIAPLQ